MPSGNTVTEVVPFGDIKTIPLHEEEQAKVTITPAKELDAGMGPGRPKEAVVLPLPFPV